MSDRDLNHNNNYATQAIVIGGSIAGLLSARILADNFSSVIIVERDKFPTKPEIRKGAPQSVQPHVLLVKGYKIIEELFPGIENTLIKNGALTIDWVREFYHFSETGWSPNVKAFSKNLVSKIISCTCSRPLLEWTIRQELLKLSNIKFIEEQRVTGLLYSSSQKKVTGVSLQSVASFIEHQQSADLVVDTSGRSSQAPKWLENLGFPSPPETVVNPLLGYVTRRYKEPKSYQGDWKIMLIAQAPPNQPRLGYLAKIEDKEWIATLGGYGGDYPPTDDKSFLEFASTLANSEFYNAINQAEPISDFYAYRATSNRLRHYDLIALPQGFISLGDAVCALCPVYGQGMTVSALGAKVLHNWLKKSQKGFFPKSLNSSSFQKSLAREISLSWSLATARDLRFPSTTSTIGEKKTIWLKQIIQWYTRQLIKKATLDLSIYTLFIEVSHLLRSPMALYNPWIIFKVILNL